MLVIEKQYFYFILAVKKNKNQLHSSSVFLYKLKGVTPCFFLHHRSINPSERIGIKNSYSKPLKQ